MVLVIMWYNKGAAPFTKKDRISKCIVTNISKSFCNFSIHFRFPLMRLFYKYDIPFPSYILCIFLLNATPSKQLRRMSLKSTIIYKLPSIVDSMYIRALPSSVLSATTSCIIAMARKQKKRADFHQQESHRLAILT